MIIFRRLCVLLLALWAVPAYAQSNAQQAGDLDATTGSRSCVVLPSQGMGTGSVQVVGTWVGTVSFTVANTGDAADYKALNMAPSNSSTQVTGTTANGLWSGSVAGYRYFRACMTAYTSGIAHVLLSTAATGGGGAGAVSVDLTGSTISGNSAASATGSAVPAAADYLGISVAGTLTGVVAGQATMANSIPVVISSNQSSLTVLPGNTANTTAWLVTGTGGTFPATQSGTWNITNVSGTVSLPTGAATAAKQPALGTAGTASADVITVQGRASMTPILATLSGTNSVRLQDGAGTALTSITAGAQQAITVSVVDNSGNQISSFGGSGGTASAFGSTFPSGASSGTAVGFNDGTNMQAGRVVDADTSGGTFYTLATNNVFRTSGTPVEAGTSSNPWNVVFPSAQAVSGPLTDTQLRATAVPVSGTVTATGPLTDTQLRASAVPISVATIPSHAVTNVGTFAVQAAQSGTWTVTGAGGSFPVTDSGGSLTVDAPVGTPVFVRLSDGSAAITTLPVSLASVPSHAVTNAGTFSVQVTSMPADATELPAASALADAMANPTTPLIGAALMAYNGTTWDRLQPALDYSQNSVTSGQTGSLVQGAVTTSSPTYTSGRTSPVSLDTSGSLRVAVVSGSTGNAAASNTGSAVPTQAGYAGINVGGTLRGLTGVNPSGSIYAGQMDISAIAGATASVNNGTVDAGTLRVTLASNGTGVVGLAAGSATIGALTANQSVNISQMNGVTTTMGNGVSGTGVQRVTIASDSTGVVGLAAGSATIGALTANQSVNIAQMNGVTTTMGNGVSGTGVQRVTLASDGTGQVTLASGSQVRLLDGSGSALTSTGGAIDVNILSDAVGSAVVTEAATITAGASNVAQTSSVVFGYDGSTNSRVAARGSIPTSASVGLITRPLMPTDGTSSEIIDPCNSSTATISSVAISQTASAVIKAGTSAKKTYICGIFVQAADAENLSVVSGTGTVCATSTVALIGATSAANGPNGAANGGWVLPVSKGSWTASTVNADDMCLLQSGSGRVAGVVRVAVQ